jgi:hypothetical protein
MRTIPTLLVAAATAVAPVMLTAPTAHADYVCTTTWGGTISFVGNSNLCYGGGTLVTPAQPQNAPPASAPAAQTAPPPQAPVADHPLPAPPAAAPDHALPPPPAVVPPPAPGMSPGPESSWPGGVAADCANPAYAASYNFFCADVGTGGPAPAPGAPAPQVAQNDPTQGGILTVPPPGGNPNQDGVNSETDGGCNYADSHANGTPCALKPGMGDGTWVGTNDDCMVGLDGDNCIPKNNGRQQTG